MSSSLCRLSNSNFNRIRASTSVPTVFEHSASFRRLKHLINHVDTILFCGGKGARDKMSYLFLKDIIVFVITVFVSFLSTSENKRLVIFLILLL